jgi:glutamyl-tRNA(Gln) amidotransferase subunit E
MLLRSTGICKRGIGTIRQDVNISIKNGARIEIKGFQDLRSIPKIVDYEIERQLDEIKKGKPVETHVRKAEANFTTSYLRPIPSAGRMYPETDIPVVLPTYDGIKEVITIEQRQKMYEDKYGLNSDFSANITRFEDSNDIAIEDYFKLYPNVGNTLIANIILNVPKEIKRKNGIEINIFDHLDFVLPLLEKKGISSSSIEEILTKRAKGESLDIASYKSASEDDIEKDIRRIIAENSGAPFGALMGKAMAHFKGRVDGKIVSDMLKKFS